MLDVCVFRVVVSLILWKEKPYLNKSPACQLQSLLARSEQLNLLVCAHLCAAWLCACVCFNVCFNVLTYATPYKQCFIQTVAGLPSDKAPEQEKETGLWGREGWRRDRMSEGLKRRRCEKWAQDIVTKKISLLSGLRQLNNHQHNCLRNFLVPQTIHKILVTLFIIFAATDAT